MPDTAQTRPEPTLDGLRASFYTLGCKLNFAETSALAERLGHLGVARAKQGESANLCIVNTCAVTEVAEAKSRQAVRRIAREHPGATVVAMGCCAQLCPEGLAGIEGVSLVAGNEQKAHLERLLLDSLEPSHSTNATANGKAQVLVAPTSLIRSFAPACSRGNRTRCFLKVQDGCDYYCSYCAVPFARGRSRSADVASLVEQAKEAARRGAKEIVLTGVNIGDFGKSTGETLLSLLRALDNVEGIARFRISSIEPDLLTPDIISFCADSRAFMPHFHLPLQSGSDEVLRLMRRRYGTALFASRVELIRKLLPHAFIGADVIVGMRGETDALFRQSLSFMRAMPVSHYHVFAYSERPGTRALAIPHAVSPEEKRQRSQEAIALSREKTHAFCSRHIGTVRTVLTEHAGKALTDNYIKASLPSLTPDNQLLTVRLTGWHPSEEDTLTAEPA